MRNRQFHQIDFDRQRIIGNYIVDFYVKVLGLIVEIDGNIHFQKSELDGLKKQFYETLGLKIFRVSDRDIKYNLQQVLSNLEDFIILNYGIS